MTEQEFLSRLASFTDSGEHTKFKLLQNWQEYKYYRKVKCSTDAVVNFLTSSAKAQLKSHCKDVENGSQNVYKILAYNYLVRILNCYKEELRIVQDMLDEYECYLVSGNWLDFLLLRQRPIDKLWDHRGD